MGKNILWIEDESSGPLVERKNRIEAKGFNLSIAYNATIAEALIYENDFDLYIIDIRLKPGDDDKWLTLWGENNQQLGIGLLKIISKRLKEDYRKVLIYTIEEWDDIEPRLSELGIAIKATNYLSKNDSNLSDLINHINALTN